MGCVSSKHLKKQAHLEGHPETPLFIRKTSNRTSNSELSFEDYHRHLVALTSSSYGLLKMDLPKTPEGAKKSTARVGSMNDIYDKLESAEVAPSSWNEVSSVLQTPKPGLGRSISMPVPSSNNTGIQETINVADIMQGLEEDEASGYSSPCDKPQSPPPPPPPGVLRTRKHKKFDKATPFHHTIQDLDVLQANVDAVATRKPTRFSSEDENRSSPHEAGSHRILPALGRLNEDVKAINPDRLPLFIQKNVTRGSVAQCQNEQNQYVSTEKAMASQKTVVGDTSVRRDDETGLNPQVPSNITYLTSSRRRLKLTLNLEYENTFFTGTQVSQDACSSAVSSARRSLVDVVAEPDSPLFDPALLASYEKALMELRKEDWCINDDLPERTRLSKEYDLHLEETPALQVSEELQLGFGEPSNDDATHTNPSMIQSYDPLDEFEWKCPPRGEESVVLYTTTLRGIRKTFEDCNYLRETLRSFRVAIDERDVSMHLTYRNELKELMGAVPVPRVFIKGRYIGGKDDMVKLHEENRLCDLLKELPRELNAEICDGCGGVRFVPCLECSGSCKIVEEGNRVLRCPECNENGLIQCPICS